MITERLLSFLCKQRMKIVFVQKNEFNSMIGSDQKHVSFIACSPQTSQGNSTLD